MARKSRERDDYGVYHIRQKSSGLTPLFGNASDREHFLGIIGQCSQKNNCRLLSYCVADPDIYHLILDANGSDISSVMKEINIRYSIYKDAPGVLFKDRFKSQLLTTDFEPRAAGVEPLQIGQPLQYKSCRDLQESIEALTRAEGLGWMDDTREGTTYRRGCRERITTMAEAEKRLLDQAGSMNRTLAEMFKDKVLRNQLIIDMKACSTLTMKEIGQLFELSESSVSKLLNAR